MVVVVKTDVKQIDVHAERLDKCAIVQILLVKINECIYHACKVKYGEMSISVIMYNNWQYFLLLYIITENFSNYI